MTTTGHEEVLSAPLVIEYPFSRTTGPIIGAFLTGLRDKVLVGAKASDGRVIVPPTEYDPVTGEDITELVEVGPAGTVTTWAWVSDPMAKHPLDRPFAWALIRPDGADTAMLHAVDVSSIDAVHSGLRVVPRWREEREGSILDLECWEEAPTQDEPRAIMGRRDPYPPNIREEGEAVRSVRTPAALEYRFTAGEATSRFLRGVAQRKILGERCPVCTKVYVPPRGACPTDGVPTREQVELPHTGAVVSFCVVNLQFYGSVMEIPYVTANIQLDGADLPLMHLIQECPADQVSIGMRVEAVWAPDEELGPTLESIRYFRPTGAGEAGTHGVGRSERSASDGAGTSDA